MLEEKLKQLIINKYGSIRQFSLKADVPNTTIDSILKRGIDNSNVGNVIKICKALNISIDNLLDNKKIVPNLEFNNEYDEQIKKIATENGVEISYAKEKELNAEDVLEVNKILMEELSKDNKN